MITKDIEKRIRELRYKQSSWKKCFNVERDMYFKTKKQISEILKKEDNVNISVQQIGNLLTEKLSYLRSKDYHSFSDYDSNIGVSKTIKKKDNVQLKHRYRVYVMFYKFLQLAIKEKRKIDFTKFKDFGSKDFILDTNFDTWFKQVGYKLLNTSKKNKTIESMFSHRPRFETIYNSFEVYRMKTQTEMTYYEIGLQINESEKYKNRRDSDMKNIYREKTKGFQVKVHYGEDDEDTKKIKSDTNRRRLSNHMMKYKKRAELILQGICKGHFTGGTRN